MRPIKFREYLDNGKFHYWGFVEEGLFKGPVTPSVSRGKHSQYCGLHDRYFKDIYEGDVKRDEIEEDDGDRVLYFVMTWVSEWTMFAWLEIAEYNEYQDTGVEHLDTTMYWTYPGDFEEKDINICGNIYQNPELL